MKLKINFTQLNQNFDRQYAKEYHFGKESDGNQRINWSKLLELNVSKYSIKDETQYTLLAKNGIGNQIEIVINDVTLLTCITEDHQYLEIVVSNKLISRIFRNQNRKDNLTRFYFYFKPGNNYIVIDRLMYVHKDDVPEGIW